MPATIDLRIPVSPEEREKLRKSIPGSLASHIRALLGLPARSPSPPAHQPGRGQSVINPDPTLPPRSAGQGRTRSRHAWSRGRTSHSRRSGPGDSSGRHCAGRTNAGLNGRARGAGSCHSGRGRRCGGRGRSSRGRATRCACCGQRRERLHVEGVPVGDVKGDGPCLQKFQQRVIHGTQALRLAHLHDVRNLEGLAVLDEVRELGAAEQQFVREHHARAIGARQKALSARSVVVDAALSWRSGPNAANAAMANDATRGK